MSELNIRSLNEQTPATKNQIQNNKPSIRKSNNIIQGFFANSINGGMIKPILYAPLMTGQNVINHTIRANIKMLTPKTPAYQKLKGTLRTYFVPNSRVWTNWENFLAQKGGANETKIKEIPNLGGKQIPIVYSTPMSQSEDTQVLMTDTSIYRDSYVSTYIPRINTHDIKNPFAGTPTEIFRTLPKINVLPLRGFKAIYNDFERNKEYDEELTEYKNDTVSDEEFKTYMSNDVEDQFKTIIRGKRQNSYYTDYRTELLGFDETLDISSETENELATLTEFEKLIASARNQAENAQLNDWDIIAKEFGATKLTEGKVQLLGTKTFGINFNAITQSAYNINDNIQQEFQVMGEQGAYSYTEIELPLYYMIETKEEGFIHCILQISADSIFETGIDRQMLNVNIMDRYRPEFKELKDDVLYDIEKGTVGLQSEEDYSRITGYKRKFSEYFKLPNSIAGDMTTYGYFDAQTTATQGKVLINAKQNPNDEFDVIIENTPSKETFQYFELADYAGISGNNDVTIGIPSLDKKKWKDYTDLLINKNLAIKHKIGVLTDRNYEKKEWIVSGDNQFIIMGIQTMVTDMPIDENIKNNYTLWGEK